MSTLTNENNFSVSGSNITDTKLIGESQCGYFTYKTSCKEDYATRTFYNEQKTARYKESKSLSKKDANNKKPSNSKSFTHNSKWVDPKRIKKKEASQQRTTTKRNKNRRKPKPRIVVSHSGEIDSYSSGFVKTPGSVECMIEALAEESIADLPSDSSQSCSSTLFWDKNDLTETIPFKKLLNLCSQCEYRDIVGSYVTEITRFITMCDLVKRAPNWDIAFKTFYLWIKPKYIYILLDGFKNVFGMTQSCLQAIGISQSATCDPLSNFPKEGEMNNVKTKVENLAGKEDIIPLEFFKSLMSNWEGVKHNELFKCFKGILLTLVTTGILDLAKIGDKQRFIIDSIWPDIQKKEFRAKNMIDCAMQTIVVLGETINRCYTTGSFMPILGLDTNFTCLQKRYHEVYYIYTQVTYNASTFGDFNTVPDEFLYKVKTLRDDYLSLRTEVKSTFLNSIISSSIKDLARFESLVRTKFMKSSTRISPFCIGLYGGTSVGKTVAAENLMHFLIQSNAEYFGKDFVMPKHDAIARVDFDDNFESSIKLSTVGLLLDDIANARCERNNGSPVSDKIIRYMNNAPVAAHKADLPDKDAIPIRPKVVVLTSNQADFGACAYSVAPLSVTRRCNVMIEMTIDERFQKDGSPGMLDPTKLRHYHTVGEGKNTHIRWSPAFIFKVYHCEELQRGVNDKLNFVYDTSYVCKQTGRKFDLMNMRYAQLCPFLLSMTGTHFADQNQITLSSSDIQEVCKPCNLCSLPIGLCACTSIECKPATEIDIRCVQAHSGLLKDNMFMSSNNYVNKSITSVPVDCMTDGLAYLHNNSVSQEHFASVFESNWVKLASLLPDWAKLYTYSSNVVAWADRWCKYCVMPLSPLSHLMGIVPCGVYNFFSCPYWPLATFISFGFLMSFLFNVVKSYVRQLQIRTFCHVNRVAAREVCHYVRDNKMKIIKWSSITISCLYIVSNIIRYAMKRSTRTILSQGNLVPRSKEDIKERDKEENPWCVPVCQDVGLPVGTRGMTKHDFQRLVCNNTVFLRIIRGSQDKVKVCHCLLIKGSFGLVPAHAFSDMPDYFTVEVYYNPPNTTHHKTVTYLSKSCLHHISDTDISVIYFTSILPARDITKLMCTELFSKGACGEVISRDRKEYTPLAWPCRIQPGVDNLMSTEMVCQAPFKGNWYYLDVPHVSYLGLCGAPVISHGDSCAIVGIHLGAIATDYADCLSGFVSQAQFNDAVHLLSEESNIVIAQAGLGIVKEEMYGIRSCTRDTPHRKAAIRFLEREEHSPTCIYIGSGSHPIRNQKSKCVQTVIAHHVREHFNTELEWTGPKFSKKYIFNVDYLAFASRCSSGLPLQHVEYAYSDYLNQLIDKIAAFNFEGVSPLRKDQNVNGIPSVRFIDALNMESSVGFPINRPKTEYMQLLDPFAEGFEEYQHPKMLDNKFFDEMASYEELLADGIRPMSIFHSSLKDEPTLSTKTKVRVFQAAPMALSLLVRKYFLPIARILSMNSLWSECAVGISAESPEWDQWDKHVFRFGNERVLAGDFSKYDLRMPAQLSCLALKIFVDLARYCPGYTRRDVQIMESCISELAFPLVHLNGDIYMLCGTNPSGHNLTVYVNSIVNSLIFRCAYRATVEVGLCKKFSNVISLSTYGDDAIGTVSEKCDLTFSFMQRYLQAYDIKFTPPDKSDRTNITFFSKNEVDFLKRKTVYIKELCISVGALAIESILKSLCCVLQGKEDAKTVTQNNMTAASRAFFFHGREIYDVNNSKLVSIAKLHGWSPKVLKLDISFDERVVEFLERSRAMYARFFIEDVSFGNDGNHTITAKMKRLYPNYYKSVLTEYLEVRANSN